MENKFPISPGRWRNHKKSHREEEKISYLWKTAFFLHPIAPQANFSFLYQELLMYVTVPSGSWTTALDTENPEEQAKVMWQSSFKSDIGKTKSQQQQIGVI